MHEYKQTHSGVMVLIERTTDSLILTKRSPNLRHHPGEICFPGGLWEEQDTSLYATALRELHEELGIESARLMLIRELAVEETLLGSVIHPWLASIDSLQPFNINTHEVESVLRVPLSIVKDDTNYKDLLMERGELKFKSCQFTGHQEFIWGATARIMRQLIV